MVSNGTDNMVMPVAPMYGNSGCYGNNGCFGGDWAWIILLLLLAGNGWGNGFGGFGGGFAGEYGVMPYLWNTQTQNDVNRGFDTAGISGQLSGIQSAITSGFADAEVSRCNSDMAAMQTAYNNQIASMNQRFADSQAISGGFSNLSSQLAQCCCDNRLATAQLNTTIASEACTNRQVLNDGVRDILANQTAATQRILDQLCNDKIDAKNEKIADLERQLTMANLAASQTAQNAFIAQGFSNEVDQLYNRLNSCPVPTTPVYGRTPIFTCANNGCGCGAA